MRASTFWGLGVLVSLFSFHTQAQALEQCVPEGPRIALTFDDGPVAGKTPVILSILKEYNVPATFFVLGQNVRYHPEILRQIIEDGHEVGVHTYSHANLFTVGVQEQNNQIYKGWESIRAVAPDLSIQYWRAPYGNTPKHINEVENLHLKHVGWTIDTLDWKDANPENWYNRINSGLERPRKQNIILMHDHAAVSRNELTSLILSLRDSGYHLVSLSMFSWPNCPPTNLLTNDTENDTVTVERQTP